MLRNIEEIYKSNWLALFSTLQIDFATTLGYIDSLLRLHWKPQSSIVKTKGIRDLCKLACSVVHLESDDSFGGQSFV